MTHRLVMLLLVAGCLLFGAIIFIELEPSSTDDAVIPEVTARPEAAAIQRQQSPRLDELVATAVARPLFSSTRRPPQSASAGGAGESDLGLQGNQPRLGKAGNFVAHGTGTTVELGSCGGEETTAAKYYPLNISYPILQHRTQTWYAP